MKTRKIPSKFYEGRPCKLGHTLRRVGSRACVECFRLKNIRENNKRRIRTFRQLIPRFGEAY